MTVMLDYGFLTWSASLAEFFDFAGLFLAVARCGFVGALGLQAEPLKFFKAR